MSAEESGNGRLSAIEIIDRDLNGHGAVIFEEARRTGLEVALACALVEQESEGRNIFGADWGTIGVDAVPFARLPVTRERVQALIRHVRAVGPSGSNGVGLTQLTWPDFIRQAEALGGAHVPRYQCRVGFRVLVNLLSQYDYLNALEAYNDGNGRTNNPKNPYDRQLAQKHGAWKSKLAGLPLGGDEMTWERVILAHASFDDGQLCGGAYKVLMSSGIQASIANSDNLEAANAFCWPRPVGSNEFLVVGQAAREGLPQEARQVIGRPREESDYRDCVGDDLAQTHQKLAQALDGIQQGLGERFLVER